MKIRAYVVGNQGCEHYMAYEYYFSKRKALKKYQEVRNELLADAKYMQKSIKKEAINSLKKGVAPYDSKPMCKEQKAYYVNRAKHGDEMYKDIIKNLSESDPVKMDNYPHDEPFLKQIKIRLF